MPTAPPKWRPPGWKPQERGPRVPDPYYQTDEWKTLRRQCLDRDKWRCSAKDCATHNRGHGGRLTVNHRIARKQGGPDRLDNLETLCPACDNKFHAEKGHYTR